MPRHTHPRDSVLHQGDEYDTTVAIAEAIGPFPAGTLIRDVLLGLYNSASVVSYRIRADALIKRTQTGSFTAKAFIPGRFSLDAYFSRKFTANAVIVSAATGAFQADTFQNDTFQVT